MSFPPLDADFQKEMTRYWQDMDRHDKRMAILTAFRERARNHDNYSLNRFQRWFYAVKAILCVLLGRSVDFSYKDSYVDEIASWDVSSFSSQDGYCYSWTELRVGYGIFSNWRYDIIHDGNP